MHLDLGLGIPHDHFLAPYYAPNMWVLWAWSRNFFVDFCKV